MVSRDLMHQAARTAGRAAVRLLPILTLPLAFLILLQDTLIFPAAFPFLIGSPPQRASAFESVTLRTADGERIELWKSRSNGAPLLFLHGNGDTLEASLDALNTLAGSGFSVYAIDYRGFGRSSGWPSESGLYEDAESAWRYLVGHERLSAAEITILAHSLGTGPASFLAARHSPKALVLAAPYTSIPDVISARPYVRYLQQLVWTKFPVRDYVTELRGTCLSIFATVQDDVIPYEQSLELAQERAGVRLHIARSGDHYSVLNSAVANLHTELARCAAPFAVSSHSKGS